MKFHTKPFKKVNQKTNGGVKLRKLIKTFAEYISINNQYSNIEQEQIEYAMRIFIFENLKIINALIFFSLIGYPLQAIIGITVMITTKPFVGGYHENTQLKCFIATLIIIGSVIYLGTNLNMNFISLLILNGISFYCIWHQAPIINSIMSLSRIDIIKRNRKIGLIIVGLYVLIAIIFYKRTLISSIVSWTLVFQALLMFNKKLNL